MRHLKRSEASRQAQPGLSEMLKAAGGTGTLRMTDVCNGAISGKLKSNVDFRYKRCLEECPVERYRRERLGLNPK